MDNQQTPAVNTDYLRGAIKTFGSELFAYCLNIELSDAADIEQHLSTLAGPLRQILTELVSFLTHLKVQAALSDVPLQFFLSRMQATGPNGTEASPFNSWRLRSGGTIPDFRTDDDVVNALAPALAEFYPTTIISRQLTDMSWHFGYAPDFPPSLELMTAAAEAILADNSLARLFPGAINASLGAETVIVSNTGRSGGIQLATMPNMIFKNAYWLFRLRQQTSAEDLGIAVATTLTLLRALAEDKSVEVPAWVGVGNVALPVDYLDLPWGTLRPYPYPTQLEIIPSGARPPTTTNAGRNVTLGVILETSFTLEIRIEDSASDISELAFPASMTREFAKLDVQFSNTALAAMLATERNPPAACTRLWTIVSDPLSFGGHMSFKPDTSPPVAHHIFSQTEVASMQDWSHTLELKPAKSLEIPRRRILSAVAERRDPVDGFIDAVIAWESLFAGTGQGELSFRICAAMATLLHESKDGRLAELKRLSALYVNRSKVLHGAIEIEQEEAIRSRDEAVRAALECIKKLYREHPDLLGDLQRSKKIILGM